MEEGETRNGKFLGKQLGERLGKCRGDRQAKAIVFLVKLRRCMLYKRKTSFN